MRASLKAGAKLRKYDTPQVRDCGRVDQSKTLVGARGWRVDTEGASPLGVCSQWYAI